jgi:hypothetical protein
MPLLSTEGTPRQGNGATKPRTKGRIEMIRNLKALGLALVAVFAMSALAASAAQALPELTAGAHGTAVGTEIIHKDVGTGNNVGHEFTVGNRKIKCDEVSFTGDNLATSQTTLTVTPSYNKCTTTPALGVVLHGTVTLNGCDYMFHATGFDAPLWTASVDIVCPKDKLIEVHLYKNAGHTEEACTITIGPQEGLTGNSIENVAGSPNDLRIIHDVNVAVTIHGSKVLCGEGVTATYEGTTTLKALDTEGKQVNLTASGS